MNYILNPKCYGEDCMKITHVALNGPVTDNWTYQDNLLPKYHKKVGYKVSMITSKFIYNSNGEITTDERDYYVNENGIKTIRLKTKGSMPFKFKFKSYYNLYSSLMEERPDIIFVHGIQFVDIKTIVRYLKGHPNIQVYVDNHADYSNSATNWFSENILHKLIWRHYAHLIEPFTTKFYGVLPARVDFLKKMYNLPENKIELLVMGADDESVEDARDYEIRKSIRQKYRIKTDDFLIITGGKIDLAKKQTLLLMEAVKCIPEDRVKLIVFGSIIKELKDQVEKLADGNKIQYIGWINAKDSYNYFAASDLVVFPGRHSVYWEQVAGLGKPMIVKYWEGTTHIDVGGNVVFLYKDDIREIKEKIEILVYNRQKYFEMEKRALEYGRDKFLYSRIAESSILKQNSKEKSQQELI